MKKFVILFPLLTFLLIFTFWLWLNRTPSSSEDRENAAIRAFLYHFCERELLDPTLFKGPMVNYYDSKGLPESFFWLYQTNNYTLNIYYNIRSQEFSMSDNILNKDDEFWKSYERYVQFQKYCIKRLESKKGEDNEK